MKKLILAQLFFLCSFAAFGQTMTVQGKVSDAKTNETLIGASVVVKGTTNGTLTNIDGNFTLDKVPPNATLTFSFVGYISQDVAVSSQKNINIILEEETSVLRELVVVGYGTQKKSDVTGAVSSVKGKDITSIATPSVAQALQG